MILFTIFTIGFSVGIILGFLGAAILSGSRNAGTARELRKLKDAALLPQTESVSPPPRKTSSHFSSPFNPQSPIL